MPTLAFFEDEHVTHLKPIVYTRPVFDLRVGILSLRHRIELDLGHHADVLIARPEVLPLAQIDGNGRPILGMPDNDAGGKLFVNGRLLTAPPTALSEWRGLLEGAGPSTNHSRIWRCGGVVAAAWIAGSQGVSIESGAPIFEGIDEIEIEPCRFVERLWDLTRDTARFIDDDASAMGIRGISDDALVSSSAIMEGGHFMAIGAGAVVEAGAVLVSEEGPIIIESHARILAGAILRGPCHVGKGSHVRMGARLASASIGEHCRAGGEISNSILQGFSNKAHDGYVGNSYIGAWCNLGADTNTSNLRNDYGEVTLYNEHLQKYEPSGQQFLGLIMGDHSRSGINTMFNTGTVVGVASNIFGAGYQPRHIPSFSWGSKDRLTIHSPETVYPSIRAMMTRRGQVLTPEEESALRLVYQTSVISH